MCVALHFLVTDVFTILLHEKSLDMDKEYKIVSNKEEFVLLLDAGERSRSSSSSSMSTTMWRTFSSVLTIDIEEE